MWFAFSSKTLSWLNIVRTQFATSWFKIYLWEDYRVHSFWLIRISDLRSFGSLYIKWMERGFVSSLMCLDLSDLVVLIVIWNAPTVQDSQSLLGNHYTVTFFFQDVSFVDTLVNLAGVIIECLDFSIPGLFALATTAAGKSPNTTPTKWTRRFQKPMGNFTSLVHLMTKLLSACERTSSCQVYIDPEWSSARYKWQTDHSARVFSTVFSRCNLWVPKAWVFRGVLRHAPPGKILKSGPLRMHFQHSGATILLFLNRTQTSLNFGFSYSATSYE